MKINEIRKGNETNELLDVWARNPGEEKFTYYQMTVDQLWECTTNYPQTEFTFFVNLNDFDDDGFMQANGGCFIIWKTEALSSKT